MPPTTLANSDDLRERSAMGLLHVAMHDPAEEVREAAWDVYASLSGRGH